MPYGHIRQYQELVDEAQRKRIQIIRQQQQQIAKLYRDIAKDLGKDIARKGERTLTYRWLKDYAKSLKRQSTTIYSDLQRIVSSGILNTAETTVGAEQEFWSGVVSGLSERFLDVFSTIPQTCVDELMNGGIYKDFTGLSERLWNYRGKFNKDIGYIINRGIIEQKSAYDLAKDLELYVDPRAEKPWEWRKVYPECNQVVDYNAQRLARTSVTHAYQLSFQRSTVDNPFIEKYQWHSSNAGKTCDLCRQRDGKLFDKDMVPLDHPNGMCIITAVISKNMDEIAEELSDWASGGSNPALEQWLGNGNTENDVGDKLYMITHPSLKKKLGMFDKRLGKVKNKNIQILLTQAMNRVVFRQTETMRTRFSLKYNTIYLADDTGVDTIAHELFHEIDMLYGITASGELRESLKSDYAKLIVNAQKSGKSIPDMLYSLYPEAFTPDENELKMLVEYRGVSDILNGISGGKIKLGFSHSNEYWKKSGRLEAEAWAQIGRILFVQDDEVIKFVEKNFPAFYAEAINIIERMTK